MKDRMIVKWNNGNFAILCSKCSVIIKTGNDFTKEETNFVIKDGYRNKKYWMPPQYCDKCIWDKTYEPSLSENK